MTKFIALFLKILITVPIVAWLFFLTLENREQTLTINWSPFTRTLPVSLPLIIFGSIVAGFIWGSLILWSNTLQLRADHRAVKKKAATLEKDLGILQLEAQRIRSEKLAEKQAVAVEQDIKIVPRIASPEIL